tara:strand:+ start:988 stop:1272 length:285 start_codon:yes stop_codon:yes gene_type:complete
LRFLTQFFRFIGPKGRILAPLTLLLIPAVAMLYTDAVDWSLLDFLVMGILLLAVGWGINWSIEKVPQPLFRRILQCLIIGSFLLIWIELAVGLF